jgi:uncharacterized phage protein (TIGR02218 family)
MQAHLDTGATTMCLCWRLDPVAGPPLGFTDHDEDIAFNGVTFEARSGFSATGIESGVGLKVDNLDVAGALTSDRLSEEELRAGAYDNAGVEIWLVNWAAPDQRVLVRKGNLGEVSHGDLGFTAEVRGLSHLLDQPQGRLFAHGCDAVLGDQRCTVDLTAAAYRGSGTVLSIAEDRVLTVSGLTSFADDWFARGRLVWTSGANSGRAVEVKRHRGATLEIWQKMSAGIVAGDQFTLTAGCDKQFSTCREKFNNGINFRGFPHMPGNDFVVSHPNRDDGNNDGSSRN